MNENQLQRLREYIDNHQNARRDATWAALCEAFGTSPGLCAMHADPAFATFEDEVPNEARRWSAVACGSKDRPNMCGVRDQFGNWYVEQHDVRWNGGLGEAQDKARELNRQALNV